jgi:acetyl esterase/lipase
VISYRLVWNVTWQEQAADVARAVAWVQKNMRERGARPKALFVMGHSAGAQLAMRVAVEPKWLQGASGSPTDICGVIAVSGAGYDFEDDVTQKVDTDKGYYRERFMNGDTEETWRGGASPLRSVDADDPPFLVLLADSDYPSVHRQARLADEHLQKLGLSRGFVIVPEVDHERMVLELRRADHAAGPAILEFLRNTPCPR